MPRIDRARRVGVDRGECVGGTGATYREYENPDRRRQQDARCHQSPPAPAREDDHWRGSLGTHAIAHWSVERRILRQDRSLELAELAARLDAGVLDEQRSTLAIAVERLGLAPGAVQGEHELRARALAQRRFLDPVLQLRDQLLMPAERERAVDPLLVDEPALVIEPCGSGQRLTFERDIGERIAAPERERLIVRPQRVRVAGRRRPPHAPPW